MFGLNYYVLQMYLKKKKSLYVILHAKCFTVLQVVLMTYFDATEVNVQLRVRGNLFNDCYECYHNKSAI